MLLVIGSLLTCPAYSATLTVPGDYPTIEDAIDAATSGDSIIVEPGTYVENLSLESGVNITGSETARTILRAASNSQPIVTISNETNIVFRNFTLSNSDTGIDIDNSNLIDIANVVMERLDLAVIVDDDSTVALDNNVFWNNDIAIDRDTQNVVITNNVFSDNDTTITSPNDSVDDDLNVSFNCFHNNDDLGDAGLGDFDRTGDPLFVDVAIADFHLRVGSPCIDAGTGNDLDNSVADIGAYGGMLADERPYPVPQPVATDTSTTTDPRVFNIDLSWSPNLDYRVSDPSNPGRYLVYYNSNAPGPDYNGEDAGGGTQPSPIDVGLNTSFTLENLDPEASAPEAPEILSLQPGDEEVTLTWTSVENATSFEISYGEDSVEENQIAVGQVTEFTVGGLSNNTVYTFAVSAQTQATYFIAVSAQDSTQNESVLSPEISIGIGDIFEGPRSLEMSAIPEAVVPVPNLADECFIATAAYGASWATEVTALRDFRDRFLLSNDAGRAFTYWYYRTGPTYAAYLDQHSTLKPIVRATLLPLVVFALFMLSSGTATKLILLGLVVLLGASIVRRRVSPQVSA